MSTFKNFVQCRVTTPITAVADSIGLFAVVPPYSLPSEEGGLLVLTDSPSKPSKLEVISYTSRSALGLYGVTRGLEGTSALEWTGPVYCYQSLLAGEFKNLLDSKADEVHTHTTEQVSGLGTAATKNVGTGMTLVGSAFNVTYGTAVGTAAQGNDSRIVNGQTAFSRLNIGSTPQSARTALELADSATMTVAQILDGVGTSSIDHTTWLSSNTIDDLNDSFLFSSTSTTVSVPSGLTRDVILISYKKTVGGTEQLTFTGSVDQGNTDTTVREGETTSFSLLRLDGLNHKLIRLGSGYNV